MQHGGGVVHAWANGVEGVRRQDFSNAYAWTDTNKTRCQCHNQENVFCDFAHTFGAARVAVTHRVVGVPTRTQLIQSFRHHGVVATQQEDKILWRRSCPTLHSSTRPIKLAYSVCKTCFVSASRTIVSVTTTTPTAKKNQINKDKTWIKASTNLEFVPVLADLLVI